MVVDPRLDEVVRDAFVWAFANPEEITLMSSRSRGAYRGHTPNMVGFSSLLWCANAFAADHDLHPVAFVHDRQSEFATSMKEMHGLLAGAHGRATGLFPVVEQTARDCWGSDRGWSPLWWSCPDELFSRRLCRRTLVRHTTSQPLC
jgi:hypothetical protein